MARYAGVEVLSQRLRRARGTGDGLWFAVTGRRFGVYFRYFRQSGQFVRPGWRRWRGAALARNWMDFWSSLWSGSWIWICLRKAASHRVSLTRQARLAAECGATAARLLRYCRSRLARGPGDRA